MNQEPDLGEQALDKATEVVLSSQLDEVENLEVDIRTNPLQIVQGKVDSVNINGQGLVIKQDLRAESVKVQTNAVSINPLKVVTGEIELEQPAQAQAQVLITEADLNRALQSTYLREKLKQLAIEVDGKTIPIEIHHINLQLLEANQIDISATIRSGEKEASEFQAVVQPVLKDNGQRIELEILSAKGQGLSLKFLSALFQKVVELLDFRNFELGGMSLHLNELETYEGKLSLQANTTIEKLPSKAE
jgi:hypothetical protein